MVPAGPTARQARRRTIVPAPAVDRPAAQSRAAAFIPGRRIIIEPHRLRQGVRIGRRVLTGKTAVRWTAGPDRTGHWEPVPIPRGCSDLRGLCWFTTCDCGVVRPTHVSSLVCGQALSCGCFRAERCSYEAARRRETRVAERTARELDAAYAEHAPEDRRIAREANRIAAGVHGGR